MIEVRLGEMLAVGAGAYLRPITAEGAAATAGARRLEIAAGPVPAEQLQRFGEVPIGSAVITGAGSLPAEYLIHVVVRSHEQPVTTAAVRRGLTNGLRRLDEWGVESAALPLLGTGAGCLDPEEAVAVVVPLLVQALAERPRRFVLVAESEYELDLIERELRLQGAPCGGAGGGGAGGS